MKKQNKEVLLKRLKSLGWRAGMMGIALIVQFALDNLSLFELPEGITIVLGLVLGEVSKYLNK